MDIILERGKIMRSTGHKNAYGYHSLSAIGRGQNAYIIF